MGTILIQTTALRNNFVWPDTLYLVIVRSVLFHLQILCHSRAYWPKSLQMFSLKPWSLTMLPLHFPPVSAAPAQVLRGLPGWKGRTSYPMGPSHRASLNSGLLPTPRLSVSLHSIPLHLLPASIRPGHCSTGRNTCLPASCCLLKNDLDFVAACSWFCTWPLVAQGTLENNWPVDTF